MLINRLKERFHKKQFWFLIFPVLASILMLFYWYEFRPSEIRQNCTKDVVLKAQKESWSATKANNRYRICLSENGLQPESLLVNTD